MLDERYHKYEYYKGEKRISAEEYIRNLQQELQQYKQQIDELKKYTNARIQVLEVSYSNDKNDEYLNAKLFGAKKELEYLLSKLKERDEK